MLLKRHHFSKDLFFLLSPGRERSNHFGEVRRLLVRVTSFPIFWEVWIAFDDGLVTFGNG